MTTTVPTPGSEAPELIAAGDADLLAERYDEVRYLVAADGLHSPVRRMLGLDAATPGRRRFGLRCHVQQAPWSSYVEVHWSRRAEAYVTPVDDDPGALVSKMKEWVS